VTFLYKKFIFGFFLLICSGGGKQFSAMKNTGFMYLPFTAINLMLQSYKGWMTSCSSPIKCQESHGKVSLKAKSLTEV
jgi:hypothetical protein